jgi:hypothetical protein
MENHHNDNENPDEFENQMHHQKQANCTAQKQGFALLNTKNNVS